MNISENAVSLLAARSYRGVGPGWINEHLADRPAAEEIVRRLAAKAPDATGADFAARCAQVRRRVEALGDALDGVTALGDPDFPPIPASVKPADRPVALFYRGDLGLLRDPSRNVAVIGLLGPTEAIAADERRVVAEYVAHGFTVVSGLALGCDTVGHRETLDRGGRTVAFLASPLNEVNPPSNRPLAAEIVEKGGLLVTEYYEKAHSRTEFLARYPARDRLQAMFAGQVVLAASYAPNRLGLDSGSRFALDKAKCYGIPRAVIYDRDRNASDPMFDLNRAELAAGARPIDVADLSHLPVPESRPRLRQDMLW